MKLKCVKFVEPFGHFIKFIELRRLKHLNIFHDQFRGPTSCLHFSNDLRIQINKIHLRELKNYVWLKDKINFSKVLRWTWRENKYTKYRSSEKLFGGSFKIMKYFRGSIDFQL